MKNNKSIEPDYRDAVIQPSSCHGQVMALTIEVYGGFLTYFG